MAQTNTTFTTSTTGHTTYTVPGGSNFGANECPFLGTACPAGRTAQVTGSNQTITEEIGIGPGTILVGTCRSQSFVVLAGTTNINENTHTETFVTCLTSVPTMPVVALIATALLLAGAGVWRLSQRRGKHLHPGGSG